MKFQLSKKMALMAAGVGAMISAAVIAGPQYYWEIHYYSDSTFTQSVGEESRTCTGLVVFSGQRTDHYVIVDKSPCWTSGGGL